MNGSLALPRAHRGFTLVELLVVMVVISVVAGMVVLNLRDPRDGDLDRESERLVALLESARAQARVTGLAVRWRPLSQDAEGRGFVFEGLPPGQNLPTQWLNKELSVDLQGRPALTLGPEPMIGPQRVIISLPPFSRVISTDGLAPFQVQDASTP